jgi:hypothetical protein
MTDTMTRPKREPCVPGERVIDPAQWTGAELKKSQDWIHYLTEAEIADIHKAVKGVEAAGLDIMDIGRETFPLPAFGVVIYGRPPDCKCF